MNSEDKDNFGTTMRQIVADASLTETEVVDIADSPNLWRSVRREIENERSDGSSQWLSAKLLVRALALSVPTAAAAAILIAVALWPASDSPRNIVAEQLAPQIGNIPSIPAAPPVPVDSSVTASIPTKAKAPRAVRTSVRQNPSRRKIDSKPENVETKTEFIALSYARNPDSGQIVRVKVPSSMMVTLGLVQTVEKPTDMIDAEVMVGDDGLTRAIRFIR